MCKSCNLVTNMFYGGNVIATGFRFHNELLLTIKIKLISKIKMTGNGKL